MTADRDSQTPSGLRNHPDAAAAPQHAADTNRRDEVAAPGRAGAVHRTLERLRILVVAVAVVGLSLTTLTTLVWATARAVRFVALLVTGGWAQDAPLIDLLEIIDLFLVAVVQLIVVLGLYELFIADLDLPDWLTVHDLGELKRSVVDLLVVIIGIKYLERSLASTAGETLNYGIATAVVILALVAFTATERRRRHHHDTPDHSS